MSINLSTHSIIKQIRNQLTTKKVIAFVGIVASIVTILSFFGINPICTNKRNVAKSNILIERIIKYTEEVNKSHKTSNVKSDFDDMIINQYKQYMKQHSGNTEFDHIVRFRTLVLSGIYYQGKGVFKEAISYYKQAISLGLPISDANVCIADLHYDLAIVDLIRKDKLHIDNINLQLYLTIDEETRTIFKRVKNEFDNAEQFEYLDEKLRFEIGTIPLEKVNHRKSQINNIMEGNAEIFINNYYEAIFVIDWYEKVNSNNRNKMNLITPMKKYILETVFHIADRAVSESRKYEKTSLKEMIREASVKVNLYGDEYGAKRLLKKATELYSDSALAHYNYGNFLFNFFRKREGYYEAEKHLRKALELDPNLKHAQMTLDRIESMKANK